MRAIDWSPLDGLDLREPVARVLDDQPAERVLDRFLRANRHFTAAQRKVCAEALFGVGLWRRRLAKQNPDDLLHALTHLGPDPRDFADRHSLPDWLAAELQRTPDPEALADALNQPGPICLRARDDRDALARALRAAGIEARPGAHAPRCLVVTSERPNLLGLDRADFEVQDEGSQLLGELVAARPGETVLDLCAGAGGKTLQLAAAGAKVYASDVDLERLERLRRRAERAGATNVFVLGREGLDADAVLVDAPCSELGALRRGPDLRWRIDPASFAALPRLQLDLLERGARHARRRLVYATCTFRREENDDVCAAFEAAHPELRRTRDFFRCWPHVEGTDAFFGSVYERV
ncbi:MAG: RsmB/NOP family class I SAM-dependent RNA methyltransferase [Myxococcaceae bacterium]|nr:RsmB/NOP family class I SAM-dependent RNA methyltransferase [Myxococcaceae bacterium]